MFRELIKYAIVKGAFFGLTPPIKKNKSKRLNNPGGFTIIEVVMASVLLIIVLVPILKALTTAHVTTTAIEQKTVSLMLAQAKLDEIKASSIYHYGDDFTESSSSLGGGYLCDVGDASAGDNLRTITVDVGYDLDENGSLETDEVEISLATYLARRL